MLSSALGLVSGLVLAAVFGAAGVGKLTDRSGTRKAVEEFQAPKQLVAPLAVTLPIAELAVVAMLLLNATRTVGAAGALILLAVFSAVIGVSLAHGRTPDCHCFGQLHSAPASWKTLARNAALAGTAVIALIAGGPGAFGWMGNLTTVERAALVTGTVAAVSLGGIALAFVSLLRSHGRALVRLDSVENALREAGIDLPEEAPALSELGIDPGSDAPAFTVDSVTGESTSLDDLLEPGLPVLLLFTALIAAPAVRSHQRSQAGSQPTPTR